MFRSLRTGVSGLQSHQTRMDVVGNNIANVNTVAFKRGRAAFGEMLGQSLLGVGRTAGGSGINPSHVGLGVAVSSIDQNWGQGTLETTGIATDLALQGDGFFVTRRGDQNLLTRAGNFTLNRRGELVSSSGLNVQGWAFDEEGKPLTGTLQDVMIDLNAQIPAQHSENVAVGGNLSAKLEDGDMRPISMQVYDEQGRSHNVTIEFTKTATANQWDYEIRYAGDPADSPFAGPVTGQLTFNTDGSVDSITGPTALTWDAGYVAGGPDIAFDLENLTQNASSTTAAFREQDGYAAGTLASYNITPDGVVELNFTNGEQQSAFQLAVGNVNNPSGLEQLGENYYALTNAAGDLQLGQAGRDLRTSVIAGALEMSNVDLATEFTDMIVAQRGYQASARVITTSDEMLQETVQLKR